MNELGAIRKFVNSEKNVAPWLLKLLQKQDMIRSTRGSRFSAPASISQAAWIPKIRGFRRGTKTKIDIFAGGVSFFRLRLDNSAIVQWEGDGSAEVLWLPSDCQELNFWLTLNTAAL